MIILDLLVLAILVVVTILFTAWLIYLLVVGTIAWSFNLVLIFLFLAVTMVFMCTWAIHIKRKIVLRQDLKV